MSSQFLGCDGVRQWHKFLHELASNIDPKLVSTPKAAKENANSTCDPVSERTNMKWDKNATHGASHYVEWAARVANLHERL